MLRERVAYRTKVLKIGQRGEGCKCMPVGVGCLALSTCVHTANMKGRKEAGEEEVDKEDTREQREKKRKERMKKSLLFINFVKKTIV